MTTPRALSADTIATAIVLAARKFGVAPEWIFEVEVGSRPTRVLAAASLERAGFGPRALLVKACAVRNRLYMSPSHWPDMRFTAEDVERIASALAGPSSLPPKPPVARPREPLPQPPAKQPSPPPPPQAATALLIEDDDVPWTDELRDECKRLFITEGRSATQTATRLNQHPEARRLGYRYSRNAVIGLSFRGGWSRDPEIARLNSARAQARLAAAKPPRPPRPDPVPKRPMAAKGAAPAQEGKHSISPKERMAAGGFRPAPLPDGEPIKLGAAFDITPTAKLWTERAFGECAWPVGTPDVPALQLSCCRKTGGQVYCPEHAEIGGKQYVGSKRPPRGKEFERSLRRYVA